MNASISSFEYTQYQNIEGNKSKKKKIKNICISLYFRVSASFDGSIIVLLLFSIKYLVNQISIHNLHFLFIKNHKTYYYTFTAI